MEAAMTDRHTCHDMEMLCRQRAVLKSANAEKWLAEAERWRRVAYKEAADQFQGEKAITPEDERK
jgi:hypothetical protein